MPLLLFVLACASSVTALPGSLGVDHVGFVVPNASAAADFLVEALGCRHDWRVQRETTPTAGERGWDAIFGVPGDAALVDVWMLKCGPFPLAQYVELFQWHTPSAPPAAKEWPGFSDNACSYLAVTVESVAQVVHHLKTVVFEKYPGLRMIQDPPMQFPLRGELCTSFFFTTPWGMWIEVSEWSESTPKHPHHSSQKTASSSSSSSSSTGTSAQGEAIVDDAGRIHSELVGTAVDMLETPATIVDLDVMELNVKQFQERLANRIKWVAVVKAHGSARLAEELLRLGASGVLVLTLEEAERMAAGIASLAPTVIHLHNQIVAPSKIIRLVQLARMSAHTIRVNVDSVTNVVDLANAALGANTRLDVMIELNIGHNRSGVDSITQAVALAKLISSKTSLKLAGITGYEGHTPVLPPAEKEAATQKAHAVLEHARKAIEDDAGIRVDAVSGGGSSNYVYAVKAGVVTELQAGGVALCDKLYLDKAGLRELGHQPALHVLTTVTSVGQAPARATADAGIKSVGMHPFAGLPLVSHDCWEATGLSAEHLRMRPMENCTKTLSVGERLAVIPGYADMFLNRVPVIYGVRNGSVEKIFAR